MPSRVVRASLNTSESLRNVSLEAELLFVKLILLADDYGRLDGRLEVIRGGAYPLRPEVTLEQLERWLGELEVCDGEASGPVSRYTAEGRQLVRFVKWEAHRGGGRRGRVSKYPPPTGEREPSPSAEFLGNRGDPSGRRETGDEKREAGGPAGQSLSTDLDPCAEEEAIASALRWVDFYAGRAGRASDPHPPLCQATRRLVAARLAEHPRRVPERVLAGAVHGYWILRGKSGPRFDPLDHLNLTTILAEVKHPTYLAAYEAALEAGHSAPFSYGQYKRRRLPACVTRQVDAEPAEKMTPEQLETAAGALRNWRNAKAAS